jgi:GTP pyrophosphokinase
MVWRRSASRRPPGPRGSAVSPPGGSLRGGGLAITTTGTIQIEELVRQVQRYHPQADLALLERAYTFAARVHRGQERVSGEPFLSHPLAVAGALADLKLDTATLAAGLLHDVVEDTHATLEQVREHFGDEVAGLVDGVTKISQIPFSTKEEQQAENFRKMVLAMSRDIRVILVKLADRLHNMRTLDVLPPEKRQAISRETLDIYAPLAHRLGIHWIKAELEDWGLRFLDPEAYYDLVARVAKKRREREGDVNELIAILQTKLRDVDIQADITGRPKHFYSIYKKMRDQGKEFDEIYDLMAVRVITHSLKDCYGTLGVIHTLWKPISGRFKDFIAMPKSNMYQSLHTTVIGPKGDPVEIQIRTWEMHQTAEEGIAAHWAYKEGRAAIDDADGRFRWLRQLVEWQQDLKDSKEFLDTVRVDLFPDEVYVFTPKGDVKSLPKGATPLDFAFAVHTNVGLRCHGAKVSGRLVPLKTELQNGDIVEILTGPHPQPSKDWLKIVKTPRARSKIKQWIRNEERVRSVALGRDLIEREARRLGLSLGRLLKPEALAKVLGRSGWGSEEEFLAAVGYGKLSPRQALTRLLPPEEVPEAPEEERERRPERRPRARGEDGVTISGIDDILVHFARCCSPVPGDEIIGFITRGRGVSIHTADCINAQQFISDPARRVKVTWDGRRAHPYPVSIRVILGGDRPGILAELSAAISSVGINIAQAEVRVTEDRKGINTFVLEVVDLAQLQAGIRAIQRVQGVASVERLRST